MVRIPLAQDPESAAEDLGALLGGRGAWVADSMVQMVLEGLCYDPVCPGILTRTAGEAAARARLRGLAGSPCSLLFGDVDDFAQFNRTHGHAHGDQALRLVASVFRSLVDPADPVWRIGDEFCALVAGDLGAAQEVASRVCAGVASLRLGKKAISVTVSVGAASAGDLPGQLAECSRKLIQAKKIRRGAPRRAGRK